MNYIKHLNGLFQLFARDTRLNPTHISLYMALFQFWNMNRFPETFYLDREETMLFSKIGSKTTYHRCLKQLHNWNYIVYVPSHNPFKGSRIKMPNFGTSDGRALDGYETSLGQAMVSYTNNNKPFQTSNKLSGESRPKNELVVKEFFKKKGWPPAEGQRFYNHYQGVGWKVGGKAEIENWRATAENWMLRATQLKTKQTEYAPSQNRDNLMTISDKNYNEPL